MLPAGRSPRAAAGRTAGPTSPGGAGSHALLQPPPMLHVAARSQRIGAATSALATTMKPAGTGWDDAVSEETARLRSASRIAQKACPARAAPPTRCPGFAGCSQPLERIPRPGEARAALFPPHLRPHTDHGGAVLGVCWSPPVSVSICLQQCFGMGCCSFRLLVYYPDRKEQGRGLGGLHSS